MGAICSDPQVKPTYNPLERNFSIDERDSDINSSDILLSSPQREFNKFRVMDRTYHQGGHRPSRYIKPCSQQTKRINPTNEEVIVLPDFGRTHSLAASPQEIRMQRSANPLIFQENSRDIIGSLCDYEAKEQIKQILEPIILKKVRLMVDQSVEELLVKVTSSNEIQNSINAHDNLMPAGNHTVEKASSGIYSGHTSKRSSGEQRRSENSPDSISFYFQPQGHQTKKCNANEARRKEIFLNTPHDLDESKMPGIVNPSIRLSQISSTMMDPEYRIPHKITNSGEHPEILGEHTKNPFSDSECSEFEQKESSPPINVTVQSTNTSLKISTRKPKTISESKPALENLTSESFEPQSLNPGKLDL